MINSILSLMELQETSDICSIRSLATKESKAFSGTISLKFEFPAEGLFYFPIFLKRNTAFPIRWFTLPCPTCLLLQFSGWDGVGSIGGLKTTFRYQLNVIYDL